MRQRILIQPMRERHARDRHAQIAGIGEVRKTVPSWRMFLREKDRALAAVSRSPLPQPAAEACAARWGRTRPDGGVGVLLAASRRWGAGWSAAAAATRLPRRPQADRDESAI